MEFKWKSSFAAWCRVERTSSPWDGCPLLNEDIWISWKQAIKGLRGKGKKFGFGDANRAFCKPMAGDVDGAGVVWSILLSCSVLCSLPSLPWHGILPKRLALSLLNMPQQTVLLRSLLDRLWCSHLNCEAFALFWVKQTNSADVRFAVLWQTMLYCPKQWQKTPRSLRRV